MEIKFGTSGWRGVIAEDFTFENVRIATKGIAIYLTSKNAKSVVMGYDTRFLSEDFAAVASKILAKAGIKVFLSTNDLPTPVIAYEIRKRQADGGINFTASHNDYIYNGLKFSAKSGGPALPEDTQQIESNINRILANKSGFDIEYTEESDLIETFESTTYSEDLVKLIDLEPIKSRKLSVVYEPFFGTGRRFTPGLLEGITNFTMIHGVRDPLFAKMHPEPIESNLIDLRNAVVSKGCDLGVSTDGDADRFGFVDKDGSFISPDKILSIIYYYLLSERGFKGNVVRTVATTHLLDRIAKGFGFEALETPVGFKYIGDALEKGEAVFGGEESGGLSIKGWLPEKDGMLAILLVAEIVSRRKKSLTELFNELTARYGESYSSRLDFPFEGNKEAVEGNILEEVRKLKESQVIASIDEVDGIRGTMDDGSWILFRPSGTEPKMRIYFEATTQERLNQLLKFGREIFKQPTEGGKNDI
ncbi:MAG: phosphoglucomutase/phosphomannomutase family protein [Caldisericaceae bacterium]